MDLQIALYIVAGILIVIGLAGTILPMLPGIPILFVGMLLAAWVGHFQLVGVFTLVILGILGALALLLDYVAGALGAKRAGASKLAIVGAILGTLVGIFLSPFSLLLSLLLCPFIGAVLGELASGSTPQKSANVGVATWLGILLGTVAKLVLSFTMLGIFLFALFIG